VTNDASVIQRLHDVFHGRNHLGAVPDTRILAAEEALGIRFPTSFRLFLRHFGAASLCPPLEIDGLPEKPMSGDSPLFGDLVGQNLGVREALRGNIPRTHLAIAADGGDYSFYLDTGHFDDAGECCVRVLGPGRDNLVVAPSFLEFVEAIARDGVAAVLK
jgi:hypothetical protein